MAWIGAGDLKERLAVRRFVFDEAEGRWLWETEWNSWAKATEDDRSNLFSSVGIGARGVTFIMRRNAKLTLHKAFLWRGKHCFLTAITDHEQPGFSVVKAAVVDTVTCRMDAQTELPGAYFPGILTEKYIKHEQQDPMSVNLMQMVLVTAKDIALSPGTLVQVQGKLWEILAPHELDSFKNEYEIGRRVEL